MDKHNGFDVRFFSVTKTTGNFSDSAGQPTLLKKTNIDSVRLFYKVHCGWPIVGGYHEVGLAIHDGFDMRFFSVTKTTGIFSTCFPTEEH